MSASVREKFCAAIHSVSNTPFVARTLVLILKHKRLKTQAMSYVTHPSVNTYSHVPIDGELW